MASLYSALRLHLINMRSPLWTRRFLLSVIQFGDPTATKLCRAFSKIACPIGPDVLPEQVTTIFDYFALNRDDIQGYRTIDIVRQLLDCGAIVRA